VDSRQEHAGMTEWVGFETTWVFQKRQKFLVNNITDVRESCWWPKSLQ